MRLVDPLVDDPDLDPLPRARERRPPEGRRPDLLRPAVEEPRVPNARIDAGDPRHGGEPLDLVSGHDDREAVRDDAVAPANLCLR